ncbi:MAG: DNA-binding protein [Sphingobium sp.]|nr:DNA-binding protein [Sphingobium sp.]
MLSDDLLNGAAEAAKYMGLPRASIYHMTKKGLLPVIRKSRRLFYRKSDLDAAFRSEASHG